MPNSTDHWALYGPDNEILDYVNDSRRDRLLRTGLAYLVGNGRALLAARAYIPVLRAAKPQGGHTAFSHRAETPNNPKGVWTFSRRPLMEA